MSGQVSGQLASLQSQTAGCLQTAQMVQAGAGQAQPLDSAAAQELAQGHLANLTAAAVAGNGIPPATFYTAVPDISTLPTGAFGEEAGSSLPPGLSDLMASSASCYSDANSAAASLTAVRSSGASEAGDTAALLSSALGSIGVPDATGLVEMFYPQVQASNRLYATAREYGDLANEQNITSAADVDADTALVFVRRLAETLMSNGAHVDITLKNPVATVELTAPLVGLGVHTTGSMLDSFSYEEPGRCVESPHSPHVPY